MNTLPDFTGHYIRQYLLTSLLGFGASGCVYRGIDTSSKHLSSYAIKCMSKIDLTPEQLLLQSAEVFHHQIVTGSSPVVLTLNDVIQEDKYLWIVMELCEGDLYKAIHETRVFRLNDSLIKKAFIELLDGVYACHMKGVFHRDLKPENILCKEDGRDLRIADFGLATRKRICRGVRCGTYEYMSPECYLVTKNSMYYPGLADVWALGIILINMVTGSDPWQVACAEVFVGGNFLGSVDLGNISDTSAGSPGHNAQLDVVRGCRPRPKQSGLSFIDDFTGSEIMNIPLVERLKQGAGAMSLAVRTLIVRCKSISV